MSTYTVTIIQTETRTWTFDAASEEEAQEKAQEWNEQASGEAPDVCPGYDYSFGSETIVEDQA